MPDRQQPSNIELLGNYAYVGYGAFAHQRMDIFQIQDNGQVERVATVPHLNAIHSMAMHETKLYACGDELHGYDLANPLQPTEFTSLGPAFRVDCQLELQGSDL